MEVVLKKCTKLVVLSCHIVRHFVGHISRPWLWRTHSAHPDQEASHTVATDIGTWIKKLGGTSRIKTELSRWPSRLSKVYAVDAPFRTEFKIMFAPHPIE